ncbi:MAG: hypothetical protein HC771_03115 [Synechococcales cyanobacterium CRU_2_2]|nr:hypothetical protein [Synechococcales cyanobacterium CRU_2_2]
MYIRDLKVDELAAAIQTMVSDRTLQAHARQLGHNLQTEDGIAQAIDVIHHYADKPSLHLAITR